MVTEKLIVTRIGNGRTQHAAQYYKESGRIILFCGSLKYDNYLPVVADYTQPNAENVTCKKCLKTMQE